MRKLKGLYVPSVSEIEKKIAHIRRLEYGCVNGYHMAMWFDMIEGRFLEIQLMPQSRMVLKNKYFIPIDTENFLDVNGGLLTDSESATKIRDSIMSIVKEGE